MKIFLSAVSSQFRDCRNALASDLRAVGVEVTVQENFQQHGRTLLEKLEAYIAGCDRVIALVGDAYGYEPEKAARPQGRPRRSYTQWEYYFAQGERLDGSKAPRKDIFVYTATANYLAAHPAPADQSSEQSELQKGFLAAIHASGEDRNPFGSLHELCRLALRDGFRVRDPDRKLNNLPLASIGTLFKGREAFLDDLRNRLGVLDGRATAIVNRLAVHGLGGVGKTRAAVEYAWRHADAYTSLLFVSAPTVAELRANLANLAGVLGTSATTASVDDQLAAVLGWLEANPGWLLIVDNVDNEEAARAIEGLLARLQKGHVLITSRIGNWSAGVERLDLDLLAPAAAAEFLLDRTSQRRKKGDDTIQAAAIAGELGGLALALEQAGAYIDTLGLSFAEYLQRWEARRPDVLRWHDLRLMQYPASVAVTWETTFSQLEEPERRLLEILAWLAPEPILLVLLDAAPLVKAIPEPREALAGLRRFSLARFDASGDAVLIHRLVQEITRGRMADADRTATMQLALNSVNAVAPEEAMDVRTWEVWTPLAAHAEAVTRHADAAGLAESTGWLMHQLARYWRARGQFRVAEPFYRRALAILEHTYRPDHLNVAAALNNLAGLLKATNRPAEAEPLYRRALTITEQSLGSDHLQVATILNNLAGLLPATNRLAEAEPLYRRTLAITEESLGPDHPTLAIYLNNLANLLKVTNRPAEAEPLYCRALVIDEHSYGPDHPSVVLKLNNLAELLRATNRLAEAEPLYRRALAIRERSYGPDHPDVAQSLNNLAELLRATNRLAEAEPLCRRALVIDEHSYGPDHPDVATALNNLAELLRVANRPAEAEPLYRRALVIDEHSYGPDHPSVALKLNNLAELLRATNRLAEAEPLYRRALAITEQSYGPDHPDVAAVLNNLAALLQVTNRLAEAEPLCRRALAITEQSYGPDHPDVATALNNLAELLRATNRLAEAEPLCRRAAQILIEFRRQTGHEHPNFRLFLVNYRNLLKTLGKTPEQIERQVRELLESLRPEGS